MKDEAIFWLLDRSPIFYWGSTELFLVQDCGLLSEFYIFSIPVDLRSKIDFIGLTASLTFLVFHFVHLHDKIIVAATGIK